MYDPVKSLAELKKIIRGDVTDAPEVLLEASYDFGRVVRRVPGLVVVPKDSRDISTLFRYANRHRIPVSTQGASHTQGGQSLNAGGIILQTHRLNSIVELRPEENWALVESGVRWNHLVEATLELGCVPPVVTTHLHTTIGGTHSVGGVGWASFRYGSQADICLGIEVVLPTGEVMWCSSSANEELFQHALCGLGQFGVITKLRVPIRQFKSKTKVFTLVCDNLDQFIDLSRRLLARESPDMVGLSGLLEAGPAEGSQSTTNNIRFILRFAVEFETTDPGRDGSRSILLDRDAGLVNVVEMETIALAHIDLGKHVEKAQWNGLVVDPGFHCILPSRNVARTITEILSEFTRTTTGSGPVEFYLFPAYRHQFGKPLLKVPNDDVLYIFGCSPRWARSQWHEYFAVIKRFGDCVQRGGGKHYPIGCTAFGKAEWVAHYGDSWPGIVGLKQRCDPNHILNGDFLPCERRG